MAYYKLRNDYKKARRIGLWSIIWFRKVKKKNHFSDVFLYDYTGETINSYEILSYWISNNFFWMRNIFKNCTESKSLKDVQNINL